MTNRLYTQWIDHLWINNEQLERLEGTPVPFLSFAYRCIKVPCMCAIKTRTIQGR